MSDPGQRTIRDFGEQWTRYQDNSGYYASVELFDDVFGPLLRASDLRGLRVCEIGAGTGRFVNIALAAGAAHVVAVEPSDAFDVLRANTTEGAERVTYLRVPGAELPDDLRVDMILSIGVLHHVDDVARVLTAAYRSLVPGGRLAIWVYGRENNGAYIALAHSLRTFTRRLPHPLLAALTSVLYVPMWVYLQFCKRWPLPLSSYMNNVLGRMAPHTRRLVIYDQLNPQLSRFYRREEVQALLERAGFVKARLYHRHGYSWAAIAEKPDLNESGPAQGVPA